MMNVEDFAFDLPDELIARRPAAQRSGSRLLSLTRVGTGHHRFPDLLDFLNPGDLLVFNDTRVIPARLFGAKDSVGKVEVLVERITGEREAGRAPEGADAEALASVLLELNDRMLERLALGGDVPRETLVETVVSIWLRSIYGTDSTGRLHP